MLGEELFKNWEDEDEGEVFVAGKKVELANTAGDPGRRSTNLGDPQRNGPSDATYLPGDAQKL